MDVSRTVWFWRGSDEWRVTSKGDIEGRIKEKADPSPPFATTFAPLAADKRDWVRDDTWRKW